MKKHRKIRVRGAPRRNIDAVQLVHVLLAIAEEWDASTEPVASPDAFEAAVEDRQCSGDGQ